MDATTMAILWTVVALCVLSTGAIIYYARILLPRRFEERMRQSLQAFGTAIELRFPNHTGLTERIVILSLLVGRQLGLSRSQLCDLEMAAQLRDIGMCAVPYRLINEKPAERWSEAEWATYYRHTEVSGAMLELVPSLRHLAAIVRCHHTDYGKTSPDIFPSRDDLPVESRILRAVTEYIWLTRIQGSLLARDAMVRGSGEEYDPKVIEGLLQVLRSNRAESFRAYAQV